ncbi:MAG: hypothetical protein AAGF84_08055 [Planctomycetota bacterium]
MTTPTDPPQPESAPTEPAPPKRKPRRWLRRCVWTVVILLAVVMVGGVVMTRPFVLTPLLSWQLSSALGVDVTLDRAEWSWDGRVDLIGVRVDLAAQPANDANAESVLPDAEFGRLIDAERIAVSLTPRGWLRGEGVLDSIVIDGPVLRVIEDEATGQVNLRQWLAAGAPDEEVPDEAEPGVPKLPRQVQLRNGRIVVESRDADGKATQRANLPISGRFEPMPDQPGTQRLVLEQVVDPDASTGSASPPLRIEGTLSREPARIELSVDDFDVSAPLGVLAPDAVRAFWAELNPAGALPTLRAVFERPADMPEAGVRLMQAELVLDGLELSVPVEALGLDTAMPPATGATSTEPAQPHDLRMTEVNGRFVLADDEVVVEGLTGLIEGVRYHVKGRAGLGGGTVQLQLSTEPFELAEDPPFILRLPRMVRNLYAEYRPAGTFRASAILDRDPARGARPMRISGAVEVLGASATYHQFTYPLQNVTGVITFDENGLSFENLQATGPTGARVAILGQVTNPGDDAAADITIKLDNIPIDEHLYGALNAKAQRAIQMFLDTETLAEYKARGLVAPRDSEDASAFTFDLDNRGRGEVRIVRDLAVAPKSQVTTRIEGQGLRVLFEFFPYPLEVTDGALLISPERIEIETLALEGPAGVSATVVGELTREPGAAYVPNLTVQDMVVPVTDNAYLLAALPGVAREWFESFVLTGETRGQVRVFANPMTDDDGNNDDDVLWRVKGELVEGSARPFGGAFVVRDLAGGFVVDRDHTALVGMTGRRGPAVLNVSANIEHTDEDTPDGVQPPLTLTATATNLAIETEVLDLIPPELPVRATVATFFETYDPEGSTDVDLRIALPDADGTGVEVLLRPREVALTNQDTRVRARGMNGTVTVFGDHARFDALSGNFPAQHGGGFATIDGVLGLSDQADTALSFAGRTTPGSPVMRATVPEAGNTAIAALEVGGEVTVESARLLSRAQPGSQAAVEFDATLLFANNTANIGLAVTELDGTMQTSVRTFDDGTPTKLALSLLSPSLRVSGRRVDRLAAEFHNADNPDWLSIGKLEGRLYGGTLNGSGGFPLTGVGPYRMSVSLLDAALGPVIDPATEPMPDNRPAGDLAMQRDLDTGLLSAKVELAAEAAQPAARSGNGSITVRNAKLFEQRNSIAVLRVLNFALPSRQPLTGANIEFTIDGGLVRFRQLDLTGQGLMVKGSGTMELPSTELDLLLTTRNADAPTFGVFTEIFNALKDELVGIAVKGPLENPRASLTTLEGTRKAAGNVLEPVLPLSPVAPKSPAIQPEAPEPKTQPQPEPDPTPAEDNGANPAA